MLPFKKILWPTDFSEPSFKALEIANELAVHFYAELHVVHVVPPLPVVVQPIGGRTTFSAKDYDKQLHESGTHNLDEVANTRVDKKLTVHREIGEGQPADEIVRIAKGIDADLIVIATHGATGWRRVVFGSVAGKVIQHADCPVLVIREEG